MGQQAAELETPPEGSRAQEGDVKERRETVQEEAGQAIGGAWDRDNREGRMEVTRGNWAAGIQLKWSWRDGDSTGQSGKLEGGGGNYAQADGEALALGDLRPPHMCACLGPSS